MGLYTTYNEDVLSTSFCFVSDLHKYEEWTSSLEECLTKPKKLLKDQRSKSPVGHWLSDLRDSTEVESLSALQAKSVAVNEEAFEALSIRNAQVAISKTRRDSVQIIDGLDALIDLLPLTAEDLGLFKNDFAFLTSKTYSLVEACRRRGCDIQSEYNNTHYEQRTHQTCSAANGNKKLSHEVFSLCESLVRFVDDFGLRRNVNNAQIEASLRQLKERLGELVNITIRRDCQIVVGALRYPWGSICAKWSLLALWQLTQNDAYLCRIFVESRIVIQRLMRMACSGCGLVPQNNFQLKAAALRVLTYLSVNQEAIGQIFAELEAGANIVNLLSWERNELVLKEGVGLMVQITLPLIDLKKKKKKDTRLVQMNASKELLSAMPVKQLVRTLTNVARASCGRELFLLVSAALANLSFLENEAFIESETCSVLVAATKQRVGLAHDIPLKDQVITVLANVATHSPLEIISSGGLVYLLSALQLCPGPAAGEGAEPVAVERIQQKVAAALARLGSHRSCASLLLRLNAVARLVELCKHPFERNFSDTVLLACLAALRRIAATLGKNPFKQLNALDLVELDLRDSFVLYSYKCQSYV